MAIYQRKIGTPEVYDISEQSPRHISFEEAQKNNIWGQVQDVPEIRTLDGLSGGQAVSFNRAPQNNSYSIFNNALMEMLKSYQTMGTRPAQEQALDLSTQQAQRGMEQATPGMSPGQQSAVRSASQSALTPSIQGAQQRAQTFSEQLSGFKGVLQQTQSMAQALEDQRFKIQENARKMVNDSITQFGSQAFEGVNEQELAQVEKEAGLPKGYLLRTAKSLKEKELEAKKADQWSEPYALGGDYVQKNLATGQVRTAVNMPAGSGVSGSGTNIPVGDNGQPVAIDDPNYMVSVLKNSKGGKAMDASSITSLSKSFNVLDQMNELSGYITGEATGPILGILRSNNPYDVKAQLIKAQLTAIVPNLARGVYGEVGVLTDNDVALYSRTLPNLSSTEDLRKAVLAMTVKTVQRSIENQLEVQAAGGRNVSGYENLYKKLQTKTDALNKSLGINKEAQTTGNIQTDLDSDIKGAMPQFQTREQLIETLIGEYPEMDKQTIANRVYSLIDDNNQIK